MNRFENKVAIVSGAAQGIGAAIAVSFYEEGASVVLIDKNEKVEHYAESFDPEGKRTLPLVADIREETEVERAFHTAHDRFGRLDFLVNNAGVCTLNLCVDLTEAEWDLVLDVNLKGMWLCTKYFLRRIEGGSGAIVNIASQAAKRAQKFTAHYSASKMGVIGFTRAVAVEVAPKIRVNAVSPGTIDTPMIQQEINWRVARGENAEPDIVRRNWLERIPLGRFQTPSAIAKVVLFLASDEASEITGDTINVSGGAVMD
jgi:meso-butanediol dehydrogenase / (S,S)-butanediol dehydrogenase / diacetyl reductase